MINFEEELRRFQPMLEVDQVESAIHNQDTDDMANIAVNLIAEARAEAYRSAGVMMPDTTGGYGAADALL